MIHNASNFLQLLCYLACKEDGKATSHKAFAQEMVTWIQAEFSSLIAMIFHQRTKIRDGSRKDHIEYMMTLLGDQWVITPQWTGSPK